MLILVCVHHDLLLVHVHLYLLRVCVKSHLKVYFSLPLQVEIIDEINVAFDDWRWGPRTRWWLVVTVWSLKWFYLYSSKFLGRFPSDYYLTRVVLKYDIHHEWTPWLRIKTQINPIDIVCLTAKRKWQVNNSRWVIEYFLRSHFCWLSDPGRAIADSQIDWFATVGNLSGIV